MTAPVLGHGLSFTDLYDRDGLARLDAAFAGWLQTVDVDVHARLMAARAAPEQLVGDRVAVVILHDIEARQPGSAGARRRAKGPAGGAPLACRCESDPHGWQ